MKKKLILIVCVFLIATVLFYPAVDIIIEDIIDRNLPTESYDHTRVAVVDYYMFFEQDQTVSLESLRLLEEKALLRRGLIMYDTFREKNTYKVSEAAEDKGIWKKFLNSYKELTDVLLFKTQTGEKKDINAGIQTNQINGESDIIKSAHVLYRNFVDISSSGPFPELKAPFQEPRPATIVYRNITDITPFYGSMKKEQATVVYTKPLEVPLLKLKISVIGGIILTLPLIAFFLGRELYVRLKNRIVLPISRFWIFVTGTGLLLSFSAGALYSYFYMAPLFIKFLYSSAAESGAQATYSVYEFVSFVALLTLIFGLIFEMPVVNLMLNRAGFLKKKWLKQYRKHTYVSLFIVSAIITPPDPLSQIIVALPMILFYEISVVLVKIFGKKDQIEKGGNAYLQ